MHILTKLVSLCPFIQEALDLTASGSSRQKLYKECEKLITLNSC